MFSNEDYLVQLLREAGLVNETDLAAARAAKGPRQTILEYLLHEYIVKEDDLARTMAVNSGMEFVDLAAVTPTPELLDAVPRDVAARYKVVPVGMDYGQLVLAVEDPLNFDAMDSLPHLLNGISLSFVCATHSQVEQFLTEFYGVQKEAGEQALEVYGGEDEGTVQSKAEADAPIIKLVTKILVEAYQSRSSDIHLEPLEKSLRVRYRIDGVMQEIDNHPKHLHAPIVARLKIMTGKMSIDERRVPQDGRIQARVSGKDLDLRVSTVPTNHGESIVMRILDKSGLTLGLADLGFLSDDQQVFEELLGLPDGIILVTGPTGSGKTTTLYACLHAINKPDRKIITVEDPVEYQLNGINQVNVKEDIGMTFAAALRSILRQAPNIIMIGEIRDLETASIAINASLTGHLVFSTLHTNDAPSAVARLTDIGVKPFLTASAVRAIMAQRLVRRLCRECKVPGELDEMEVRALGLGPDQLAEATIMKGQGCGACRNSGFRGRLAIIEIFTVDDEARNMINDNLTTSQLKKRAREMGMRSLREDGIRKALAGMTTAAEVIEITVGDYE
ncbi:MAG: GspE/PulE family protein [Verrucomicrobiales bacterium]